MSRRMPAFSPGQLEAVSSVLADTHTGLTSSQIGHMLVQIGVADPTPLMTKWKRLYNALAERQNRDQNGDRVFAFIARAMEPARFLGQTYEYHAMLGGLNVTLSYLGYELRDDGRFYVCTPARTHSEAQARADRLRAVLRQRNVHPDVLIFCRAELLRDDCFHAVLEACKSVAAKIRDRTGLTIDGAELARKALGGESPLLRINPLSTETEKGEQRGFLNLTVGLFGTFRNPIAHEARIRWSLAEDDALDLFALASYVHRRIDGATSARS